MTWNERKFVNDVLAQNVKDVLAQNVNDVMLDNRTAPTIDYPSFVQTANGKQRLILLFHDAKCDFVGTMDAQVGIGFIQENPGNTIVSYATATDPALFWLRALPNKNHCQVIGEQGVAVGVQLGSQTQGFHFFRNFVIGVDEMDFILIRVERDSFLGINFVVSNAAATDLCVAAALPSYRETFFPIRMPVLSSSNVIPASWSM